MPTLLPRLASLAAALLALYPLGLWLQRSPAIEGVLQAQVVGGGLVAALVLGTLARWLRLHRVVAALAVVWVLLCLQAGGPTAALAFALSGLAATVTGITLLGGSSGLRPLERIAAGYLVGIAVFIAVLSPLLAMTVHFAAVYAAVCVLLCALQWRAIAQACEEALAQWREFRQFGQSWIAGVLAVLAVLLWAYGGMGTLTPIAAFDDLAGHLRLPYELLVQHRYSFDVAHQVWASAPWASDLAFAIPFVISGGNEGVKAWVAGSYHLASAVLLFGLLRRRVETVPAILLLAGYQSTPMLLAATHTMHTEAITAALVLAIFVLWMSRDEGPSARPAIAASLLLGLLGATKSSNLILCACLGLVWLPTLWRHGRARPKVAAAIVVALATAFIPYATSWVRTGNPVLPLMNAIFQSPYFEPVNFSNSLYAGMFGPGLYASLFLDGQRHLETMTAIAAGLGLFFLLPAALVVLAWRGDRERRIAMAVVLAYSLLLLATQQYIRYLLPVMALAFFAASMLWADPPAVDGKATRAWTTWWSGLLMLAIVFNAQAMPGVFWQTKLEDMADSLSPRGGRERYLEKYAPERALNRAANEQMGGHATVAYPLGPFGADLQGTPIYPIWYNQRALRAIAAVKDDASAEAFARDMHLTHVVVKGVVPVTAPADALMRFARKRGHTVAVSGNDALIALDDDIAWPRELWKMDPQQAGTQVNSTKIIAGSAAASGGMAVLVEIQGTCDSLQARPGVDLFWLRRGFVLQAKGRADACVPGADGQGGTFALRMVMEAPPKAESVWIRVAAYGELPVRVTSARVRGLAQ